MSAPLLAKIPDDYQRVPIKLLIVGQETHSWAPWTGQEGVDYIDRLREQYDKFERGKKWRSPFFQAARRLQSLLNPAHDPNAFVWLNLFIADQNMDLPSPEIADRLRTTSLLRNEIEILNPDAVAFFTGPDYDPTIQEIFGGTELVDHSRWIKIVRAQGLPPASLRTYHPKSLRLKKHFNAVIDEMAEWIKRNLHTVAAS